MHILVTGGAGYIGSHTVHQLIKAGYSPIVIDDLSTGHAWTLQESATLIQGNAGDPALISKTIRHYKIQSVIHFAGSIRVEESVSLPLHYYHNNTLNSLQLIQTCANEGVRQFVFSSTAAVYGSPKKLPVTEDSELAPLSPYGTSKLMTEWILRDYAASLNSKVAPQDRFRYLALRYFNVAGAQIEGHIGQITKNSTHLIKVACEAACGLRKSVPLYGTDYSTKDGTCIRDYIHVDDLAQAHVEGLRYLESGGESQALNCGYGHGFSVREVLATVQKVSGVNFPIEENPRRPGDSPAIVADSSRIQSLLGWMPQYNDLELICKSAYEWEKKLLKKAAP